MFFFLYFYFFCHFGPNLFEGPCLLLFFCSDTLYVWISFSIEELLTFCEYFVRAFLWVPCWINLRLIKVILMAFTLTYLRTLKWHHPNYVTYIKRSTPSKDHIIRYNSFGSCYRLYPIQFLFLFLFVICLRFMFCSVIYVLVCILLRSYFGSCSCHVIVLVSFRFCVKNSFWILF